MKKVYIYIGSFLLLATMFTVCYYFSYRNALNKFNQYAAGDKGKMFLYGIDKQLNEEESVQADTAKIDKVTPNTEYVLETYDVATDKRETSKLSTPEFLIGLNREEVIDYLSTYMKDVPLNEYEKGLQNYELLSFSKDRVVLSKTYNSKRLQFKYFIVVDEGMVVVYYSDKETVYQYTGIEADTLPEEEQRKLNYGIYVKDEEELYGILENYSS